jgi:ribosomal protein L12E/L44/L45/RPP1/RPP2
MAYAKTELAHEVLKTKSIALTPRQRAMLIMADGTKDAAKLLGLTAGIGATIEDLEALTSLALLQEVKPPPISRPAAPAPVPAPTPPAAARPKAPPAQADYKTAYLAGVALTSSLGFKGFRLNLAMESAGTLDDIEALRPKILEAMEKAHGATQAKELMRNFDRSIGIS